MIRNVNKLYLNTHARLKILNALNNEYDKKCKQIIPEHTRPSPV